jgi:hypothetical protein
MSNDELEIEQIRSLTIPALLKFKNNTAQYPSLQSVHLIIEIANEAIRAGLKTSSGDSGREDKIFSEKEHARVREVISNFFAEGLLMWGLNKTNPDPPFMSITEYGYKVLDSENIIPHDPNGFLTKFKTDIPNANDLILKYLTESIQTYRTNNLLSSSVMLGVASEAVFDILFEKLKSTLTNPCKQSKFEKLSKTISTKDRFDETMKEIKLIRPLLPGKLKEDIKSHIEGIFELIRNQRNDSGHPTGKDVSKDDLFINLRLFIPFCHDVYKLIEWLDANPLWEGNLQGISGQS